VGVPELVDDGFRLLCHFHRGLWIIGQLSYNVDN
jgi:hypothetical protein